MWILDCDDFNVCLIHVDYEFVVGCLDGRRMHAPGIINEQADEVDIVGGVAVQSTVRGPVLFNNPVTTDIVLDYHVGVTEEISC